MNPMNPAFPADGVRHVTCPSPRWQTACGCEARALAALLLLLLLLAGCGEGRRAGQGAAAAPRPALAGDTLRLVSFNVYNRPWSRGARTARATELLARLQPDVVLLQEVARYLRSRDVPSERFARRLGFEHYVYWLEDSPLFSSGEAVLSRYPLREAAGHRFSVDHRLEAKGFVHAVVATPFGDLGLVGVHLGSVVGGKVKAQQFRELAEFVETLSARMPVLVSGDFNEEDTTPLFQAFRARLRATGLYDTVGRGSDPKLKSWAPYPRLCDDPEAELLDYVLAVPSRAQGAFRLRFLDGGITANQAPIASDHCPVSARIQLLPPEPEAKQGGL